MSGRWLEVGAAGSLVLALVAGVAGAASHVWPLGWRLLGTFHSEDVQRVEVGQRDVALIMPIDATAVSPNGFWDAVWVQSRSGTLSFVAHAADWNADLVALSASPPTIVIDLSSTAGGRLSAFSRIPEPRMGSVVDVQRREDGSGIEARLIRIPYWVIVLLGLSLPAVRWSRARVRARIEDS